MLDTAQSSKVATCFLAQIYLMDDGLYPYTGYKLDDYVGPGTNTAIRFFQSDYHISVDGCVGPQTWSTMEANIQLLTIIGCSGGYDTYLYYDESGEGGGFYETNIWTSQSSGPTASPVVQGATYELNYPLTGQSPCASLI